MKYVISAALGAILGAAVGYFVAGAKYKKKLEKELNAIRDTQQELAARKEAKEEPASETAEEPKTEETSSAAIVKELSDEESDDDDDGYDYFDSDELRRAQAEFDKEVSDYFRGNGNAYVISKAEYDRAFPGHGKSVLVIHENDDRAYDANTGEEVVDWREAVAYDEGTLDEENADPETGKIYIRSEREAMDYEISYSHENWIG